MPLFLVSRRRRRSRLLWLSLALGLAAIGLVFVTGRMPTSRAVSPLVGGCPIFPADNIWNVPVNNLPVAANSANYVNSIGANTGMHPDFGSGQWDGGPIGIPYVVVPQGQPKVPVSFTYDDESDPGPYPIPPNAPIEGGAASSGDRHVLVVEQGTCKLYETWSSYPQNGGASWQTGSGAIFDLKSNNLRPAGWTSADAAGLPILPGLVRYDEVASGSINHALRFTVQNIRNSYIWPGRHKVLSNTNVNLPQMGQRFRLKANFNISGYSQDTQVILTALKTYGMFVADIGSNWYLSGAPDPGWQDETLLNELATVKGLNFEAVDESSLMINANSGQAAVAPLAPSSLAASPASTSQINLSWLNNATNQTGFSIERKIGAGGTFNFIATTGPNATSFQDTGLLDNTTYFYRIRAFNSYGSSAYVGPVSALTPLAVPIAASNLSVWATSATQVSLAWADNAHNEDGFVIERSPDGTNGWTQIGAMTSPNVTTGSDSGLTADTTYFYRIKAHNAAGDAWSSAVKVVTTLWQVTSPSDDGQGSTTTMLSYAISHAISGQSITFAVPGGKIIFTAGSNWTPTVPKGVNLLAGCSNGPGVTIDGTGLPPGTAGLILDHNVLIGLKITKFPSSPQIKVLTTGGGNRLTCVVASK